jgi:cytochrome c553
MASPTPPPDDDKAWSLWAAVIVAGVLSFSAIFGFIILPVAQASNANIDPWTAICRAVGLRPGTPAQPQLPVSASANPVSQVSWTPATLRIPASADPRPGAALASAVCQNCHGEGGISPSDDFPHLAGQSAQAIYKQLSDYRSGARANPLMTPVARQLTETQLAEVASYFAHHSDRLGLGRRYEFPDEQTARLVHRGDPARRIPPCEACHQPGAGGPLEAPILSGQHAEYVERQLRLYKTAERRNDVYRRMREIASQLTDQEIGRLAQYYQGQL